MSRDPLCGSGISWQACSRVVDPGIDLATVLGPAAPITNLEEARSAVSAARVKCLGQLANTSEERDLRAAVEWLRYSESSPVREGAEVVAVWDMLTNYTQIDGPWLMEDTPRVDRELGRLAQVIAAF